MHAPTCTRPHARAHMRAPTCARPHARAHMHAPACARPHARAHMHAPTCCRQKRAHAFHTPKPHHHPLHGRPKGAHVCSCDHVSSSAKEDHVCSCAKHQRSPGTAPLLELSRNDPALPATLFARGEPVSTYASVPTRLGFYGDCSFNEV